jgi:hypothetical protein
VKDPAVISMLDPFYPLALSALHSRYQRAVAFGMKVRGKRKVKGRDLS